MRDVPERASRRGFVFRRHNNGMHPTADTPAVIYNNLAGRRVMPGVRLLLRGNGMRRIWASVIAFSLALVAGVVLLPRLAFSPLDGGPLDANPRLVSSAESPDRALTVEVFRRRNPSYSLYAGGEMYVNVYDSRGGLLYEKLIGQDGAWSELDHAYKNITFDGDTIRISECWGRSHVIDRAALTK